MSGTTKRNLSLLLTSIGLLLAGTDAYAGDDQSCRRKCTTPYPSNIIYADCYELCMGRKAPKNKTVTKKPGASGGGFNRGAFQPSCGPGYMAVNGRCVSAKATR